MPIVGISRLQIPRILFSGYIPYLLLKIRHQHNSDLLPEKPKTYSIPLFQIPSAISDGMTNWKPDSESLTMYIQPTDDSSITFMICTPDGDPISLLSSNHTRFEKNLSQVSRFITGYSKQSNPDFVYPISEIDTTSTESFKYILQSHSVNLFIFEEDL